MQLLSESYRGKAQMINLMSYWLSLIHSDAEVGKESAHQMIEGHLKGLLLQRFDPRKADSIFSEEAVRSHPPPSSVSLLFASSC